MDDMSILKQLIYCYYLGYMVIEGTFKDPQIQALLKSNEKFDVIIMDQFYNEALLGIGYHFQVPVILLSSLESPMWTHYMVGNPDYYSYMPNAYLKTKSRMSFFKRLSNTVVNLAEETYKNLIALPYHDTLMHEYIPSAPQLKTLMRNVSLIFVNSHISTGEASPKVPNMIDIAGMHIKPKNTLPDNVKTFLDNSKEGVIYFSLGSNLKPSVLPEEKRKAILEAFSKLNVKILWKWDEDNLPGQPKNVVIGKWFPQVDVLGELNQNFIMKLLQSIYIKIYCFQRIPM